MLGTKNSHSCLSNIFGPKIRALTKKLYNCPRQDKASPRFWDKLIKLMHGYCILCYRFLYISKKITWKIYYTMWLAYRKCQFHLLCLYLLQLPEDIWYIWFGNGLPLRFLFRELSTFWAFHLFHVQRRKDWRQDSIVWILLIKFLYVDRFIK